MLIMLYAALSFSLLNILRPPPIHPCNSVADALPVVGVEAGLEMRLFAIDVLQFHDNYKPANLVIGTHGLFCDGSLTDYL